jgi:hypothetical protein
MMARVQFVIIALRVFHFIITDSNIRSDLRKIGWGDVDWSLLAQNRNLVWDLVNTVLYLQVP